VFVITKITKGVIMTNFKKIGLTALAGSLAVTAYAQAGALSVGGTARMEYQSTTTKNVSNTSGETRTDASSSDLIAQNTSISFSGSGELDNGMNVSYFSLQTTGTNSYSQSVALDMGDMGTVTMSNYNMAGIGTIQDMVPNGGEQPWDDLGTTHGGPADGIASPHAGDRLGYKTTQGGAIISASLNYEFASPTTSVAIQLPNLVEGLNIGAGLASDQATEDTENDIETMYITYAFDGLGVSVGAQSTDINVQAATSDIERMGYGISFAVNENLSLGYGVSTTEYEALSNDEESKGLGASYTSGGMKLGVIHNKKDNLNGGANDMEMTELQLTFAF
jgi:outer membrane protein OmpU